MVVMGYVPAETSGELAEVNDAVVVLVELGEQVDAVLLKGWEVDCLFLDLVQDVGQVSLRELIGVVFHVFLGVLVGRDELEAETAKEDSAADQEVLLVVVGTTDGVLVILSLHELATDAAGVLVTHLVDLDGVITAVEGDDELAVLIIGLSADELGVEAKDVHVLLEHLLHVALGRLGLQGDNRAHRVVLVTESIVGRDLGVLDVLGGGGELNGLLSDSQVLLVPCLSMVVTVEDLAVAAVDGDRLATSDVLGHVVLFLAEGHAWAVSKDWCLSELLALEKLRESCLSAVGSVDLLDLHRVVAEEEVELVELLAAIVAVVLPQDVEAKDVAVVVEELLKTTVRATTLQLHLNVVLDFGLIGRSLLHVDHRTGSRVRIIRVALWGANIVSLVGVVSLSELIALDDAEDTAVDVEVHSEAEVDPIVVAGAVGLGDLGTLQEDALRDTRVGHARLKDQEGVVIQVEVNDALADTVVLVGVLDDGLLEVSVELQHLYIQETVREIAFLNRERYGCNFV